MTELSRLMRGEGSEIIIINMISFLAMVGVGVGVPRHRFCRLSAPGDPS